MDTIQHAEAAGASAADTLADVHGRIAAYYTGAVIRFGATPRGVDWTSQAAQEMRFVQLLKLCDLSKLFSLNDFGCGYGALAAFVTRRHPSVVVDYQGIDLSDVMIQRARRRYRGISGRRFVVGDQASRVADFSMASGVMNVQLDIGREAWEDFVAETLRSMWTASRFGFAVNFMERAPGEPGSFGLYRTEPQRWVQFCAEVLDCSAEIIRGYGMPEFTLLVRRNRPYQEATASVPLIRRPRRLPATVGAPVRDAGQSRPSDERTQALQAAAAALLSPEDHADEARIHAAFRLLRREAPIYWVALPRVKPFWAVTRYRDVAEVERRNAEFIVAPRTQLGSEAAEASIRQLSGKDQLLRTLLHMDAPDHGAYRALAQPWFQPSALAEVKAWMADWARQSVDKIAGLGGECDFATQVAVPFTLRIIAKILGVPEADEPQLDRLVRGIVGADDPGRRFAEPPANPVHEALRGCRDYFDALAADRRSCPRNDLASVIANATINGAPLPQFERVSYYVVLAIAGYDTTAFALSGGLHALIEHPEQLARLQQDPALLDAAIEEILRWTSPSRHFIRTATKDTVLGGQPIRAGEAVGIFFPSANRDEAVFTDGDAFRIDRSPNQHITFGWGAHYCLGQALARMELRALFSELLPRIRSVKIAGPTRRAQSVFLTGFTSLPVRLDLRSPVAEGQKA